MNLISRNFQKKNIRVAISRKLIMILFLDHCRWNFVVGLMPMWLAPNLITIIGLAINVFTSLVHLYFCPTATEEVRFFFKFQTFCTHLFKFCLLDTKVYSLFTCLF